MWELCAAYQAFNCPAVWGIHSPAKPQPHEVYEEERLLLARLEPWVRIIPYKGLAIPYPRGLLAPQLNKQPIDELGRVTQQRHLVRQLRLELANASMNEPPFASVSSTSLPAFCLPILSASRKVARPASIAP